jgi:hypothetical protein
MDSQFILVVLYAILGVAGITLCVEIIVSFFRAVGYLERIAKESEAQTKLLRDSRLPITSEPRLPSLNAD